MTHRANSADLPLKPPCSLTSPAHRHRKAKIPDGPGKKILLQTGRRILFDGISFTMQEPYSRPSYRRLSYTPLC